MSKWDSEKEQLEQWILTDKLSYEEVGRRYHKDDTENKIGK